MVDDNDSRAKRQKMIMYSDFISNLPDNVIDQILVRVPIKDAVRTSVLSTNWRYKWTTITQLVFHDNQLIQPSPPHNNNNNLNEHKLINLINIVFLRHSGVIHKFELSTMSSLPISSSMIDAWIFFLSRKNIKELVLKFSADPGLEQYKLPTCFFSTQKITTLELHMCVLKPPPATFTCFSNLKSLNLHDTTIVDKGGFECLISKCPVLERLTLIDCILGLDNLINICSPNLKYLCLLGYFEDICFENTPLLSDVTIGLMDNIAPETSLEFLQTETRNVIKILSSLPSLKKFVLIGSFLEFLSMSEIPVTLPFTCHHLNYLWLPLNFEDVNQMCVTLCLLTSSPNLQELDIVTFFPMSMSGEDIKNFWEKQTYIDSKMSRLQVVKITNFNGFEFKSGLEFIKLLLANSPMLEMLSIRTYHNHERLKLTAPSIKDMLLLQLLRFKRASPKAVIEFPGFV